MFGAAGAGRLTISILMISGFPLASPEIMFAEPQKYNFAGELLSADGARVKTHGHFTIDTDTRQLTDYFFNTPITENVSPLTGWQYSINEIVSVDNQPVVQFYFVNWSHRAAEGILHLVFKGTVADFQGGALVTQPTWTTPDSYLWPSLFECGSPYDCKPGPMRSDFEFGTAIRVGGTDR